MTRPNRPEEIFSRIDRSSGIDSCWPWLGTLDHKGYGEFSLCGWKRKAPQVMFELMNRPLLRGEWVLHTCDNPPCVNPNHLYVGTQLNNEQDKVDRGRTPIGERNGSSKLTTEEVREIRLRLLDGETQRSLGRAFGVSQYAIWSIAHDLTWSKVA